MTAQPVRTRRPDQAHDFCAALPKVDLHLHLIGMVRAQTLKELAAKHGVPLLEPVELYARINSMPTSEEAGAGPWYSLLRVQEWICECIRDEEDFERVAFEALADAAADGVLYEEISFNPSIHLDRGVPLRTALTGLGRGLETARRQFDVDARLIAAINREDSPEVATAMVTEVVAERTDDLVGIGMDCHEAAGPPERFAEAYRLAARAGLHRTSHSSEHVESAQYTLTALDLLGCERIDHGYYVLEDAAIVKRCREDGIAFNIAFTTSRRALRPWRRERVARMLEEGLRVTINSDDPKLFPTTATEEYRIAHDDLGLSHEELARMAVDAASVTFLDPSDQAALTRRVVAGVTRATAMLTENPDDDPALS